MYDFLCFFSLLSIYPVLGRVFFARSLLKYISAQTKLNLQYCFLYKISLYNVSVKEITFSSEASESISNYVLFSSGQKF
jgi:hypothetical protein